MGVKVRERPKGSGIWWIFVDHKGKRIAKKIGKDKKRAQEAAKQMEAKLVLGEMNLNIGATKQIPNFSKYSQEWLRGYAEASLKHSTQCH